MPTPFYHISIAFDLLAHPDLPGEVRSTLEQNWAAFLFGNTAPDVQVVSGQPREDTHFFDLPIRPGDMPGWDRFLAVYQSLAQPENLSPSQAAFLAGYLCHLQADWLWILKIFSPVFGPYCNWDSFAHRLYLHNVLRAYLDRQILPGLDPDTGTELSRAKPAGWLPFVQDVHLHTWRDYLAQQLQPGASVQTVEVFAARQGLSPDAFYHLLSSEEEMDHNVFSHISRHELVHYRHHLLEENLRLLRRYLISQEDTL